MTGIDKDRGTTSRHDGVNGHFYFDPQDRIYKEHFPGNPVVPGSMIVHAFMTAMSVHFKDLAPMAVKDFRFKRFTAPGSYAYHMQRMGSHGVDCTLLDKQAIVATGSIITASEEKE